MPEALLDPPHGRGGAGVLEQHPLGVGDGQPVLGADLEQQIASAPPVLEPVDGEPRQGPQPVGPEVAGDEREDPGAEAEGHREPGGVLGQPRLLVPQRGATLGQRRRVVGQHREEPAHRVPGGPGVQVQAHEGGEGLWRGAHTGLPGAVEGHRVPAVGPPIRIRIGPERAGPAGGLQSHRRDRTDPGGPAGGEQPPTTDPVAELTHGSWAAPRRRRTPCDPARRVPVRRARRGRVRERTPPGRRRSP